VTDDIAAIKARLAAITPGPWTQWVEHGSVYAGEITRNEPHCLTGGHTLVAECIDDFDDDGEEVPFEANAAFIAAAPQDIAWLLAALEARDAEIARLRRVEAAARALDADHRGDCHLGWYTNGCTCGLDALRAALDGSGSDVG
jgi:hypothetical protein